MVTSRTVASGPLSPAAALPWLEFEDSEAVRQALAGLVVRLVAVALDAEPVPGVDGVGTIG